MSDAGGRWPAGVDVRRERRQHALGVDMQQTPQAARLPARIMGLCPNLMSVSASGAHTKCRRAVLEDQPSSARDDLVRRPDTARRSRQDVFGGGRQACRGSTMWLMSL